MDLEKLPAITNKMDVPAPTGWPMTAAFGFTLVLAGLITHPLVSVFGAVTLVMGLVGWFRAVLPQDLPPTIEHAAIAVKSHFTSAAAEVLRHRLAPDGWLVSFQNGMTAQRLADVVGWQRLIVLVAGSFMHFVIAAVLIFGLALAIGIENDNTTQLGTVAAQFA